MPYEQDITLYHTNSAPRVFSRLPSQDNVTRRRYVGSVVGLPSDVITSGKTVSATIARPVAIDQVTVYASSAIAIEDAGPVTGGVSVTINLPRAFATQQDANDFVRDHLVRVIAYLNGTNDADESIALRDNAAMGGLSYILNGIR